MIETEVDRKMRSEESEPKRWTKGRNRLKI